MPISTKNCNCGTNNWVLIHTQRIDSLGSEKIEWCKNCGTVKKSTIPNGSPNERTLDYRVPENITHLKMIKK